MKPVICLVALLGLVGLLVLGTELIAGDEPPKTPPIPNPTPETPPVPNPAPAGKFVPVTDVHHMMEGQGKLWGEIKDGILDSNWKAAENSAWLLAEVANVNQYQHEAADYKAWAKQMSDQCVELAGTLKKKDAAKSRDLVSKIGNTCSECHNKYK